MRAVPFEGSTIERRLAARHRRRWLRAAVALSLLWIAAICLIAIYEHLTIDPWAFIGQSSGPIFYAWASALDYGASGFGEVVLVLDTERFWMTLLAPVFVLIAAAALLPWLTAFIRGIFRDY